MSCQQIQFIDDEVKTGVKPSYGFKNPLDLESPDLLRSNTGN